MFLPEKPPDLEESPKWEGLKQILTEIEGETQQMTEKGHLKSADDCRVLVCAEDDSTCNHIREVICADYQLQTNTQHAHSVNGEE